MVLKFSLIYLPLESIIKDKIDSYFIGNINEEYQLKF